MRILRALGVPKRGRSAPRYGKLHILVNGQSLAVGGTSSPLTTTQPYNNTALLDTSGTYNVTLPNAATLQYTPLLAPERAGGTGTNPYPTNILGETPDVAMANTITFLAKAAGYSDLPVHMSNTGQAGQGYSVIGPGGTGNAYAAMLFEARAAAHLQSVASASYFIGATVMIHGEQDNSNPAYIADLVAYQAQADSDLRSISGQSSPVPLLVAQQNSSPAAGAGQNQSALAQWQAAAQNPTKIFTLLPEYPYPYQSDRVHKAATGYRLMGEKLGQLYFRIFELGEPWPNLFGPTSFSRSGAVVTITFSVPWAPLVWDGNHPAPHLTGTLFPWGAGKGLEAYDNVLTVSSATTASPIVVGFTAAHNLTTGNSYTLRDVQGLSGANGTWTVTVVDSTHVSLNGSSGSGSYTTSTGSGFSIIPIISANIQNGNQVVLTLTRGPAIGSLVVGYADTPDVASGNTGGFPDGRCGLLRDSDPFVGPFSGTALPNWCVQFQQVVS